MNDLTVSYTAKATSAGDVYTAEVDQLPGCRAQAGSLESLADALATLIQEHTGETWGYDVLSSWSGHITIVPIRTWS